MGPESKTYRNDKLPTPWQIELFQRSLKKPLKLKALLDIAGDLSGKKCLLLTCGDNNGALNWHFRDNGGSWTWADVTGENLEQIRELLNEPVMQLPTDKFPFADNHFDCVISIDVLEHLVYDQPFLIEMNRVLKPGGSAIVTVPNGDPILLVNRIKWRVGMLPQVYGHTRAGYTLDDLSQVMSMTGFTPVGSGGYSRFFTEMIELIINYCYVNILSHKEDNAEQGQIAPTTLGEFKTHGAAYRLYSAVFPFMQLISKLDRFLHEGSNYAVIVSAVKPDS